MSDLLCGLSSHPWVCCLPALVVACQASDFPLSRSWGEGDDDDDDDDYVCVWGVMMMMVVCVCVVVGGGGG